MCSVPRQRGRIFWDLEAGAIRSVIVTQEGQLRTVGSFGKLIVEGAFSAVYQRRRIELRDSRCLQ